MHIIVFIFYLNVHRIVRVYSLSESDSIIRRFLFVDGSGSGKVGLWFSALIEMWIVPLRIVAPCRRINDCSEDDSNSQFIWNSNILVYWSSRFRCNIPAQYIWNSTLLLNWETAVVIQTLHVFIIGGTPWLVQCLSLFFFFTAVVVRLWESNPALLAIVFMRVEFVYTHWCCLEPRFCTGDFRVIYSYIEWSIWVFHLIWSLRSVDIINSNWIAFTSLHSTHFRLHRVGVSGLHPFLFLFAFLCNLKK